MTKNRMPRRPLMALSVIAASLLVAAGAQAAEKITLQLKWLPQAQFAGYYVAAAKGYYKDAGLDVTIKKIPQKDRHLAIASGALLVPVAHNAGEFWARKDLWSAGKVSVGTFIGFIMGVIAKVGCALTIILTLAVLGIISLF